MPQMLESKSKKILDKSTPIQFVQDKIYALQMLPERNTKELYWFYFS